MTWSGELLQLAAESVTRHWERSRQLVGAAGERYLLALFPHRPLENCCTHEVNSYNLFLVIHFSLTPSQKSSPFGSLSPLSTAVVLLQKDLPMSAPDHSPSGVPLSPGEELEEEPVALLCIESTITARDSELNSLSRVAVVASNLLEEEEEEQGAGRSVQHDLQPVHAILVQLAVSLQARVDQAARDLAAIRHRLARELTKTAEVLTNLGEVV